MVVMHQLQQNNIPWDSFIAHEVFTTPYSHHQQDIPSSSHPPISTSPSLPAIHTFPPTHIPSPPDDPSTSPFHNPSPTYHDYKALRSDGNIETNATKTSDMELFPLTYWRGYRHVFAVLEVKGDMLSSPAKQFDKGKEKVADHVMVEEEDKHETDQEF